MFDNYRLEERRQYQKQKCYKFTLLKFLIKLSYS